MDAPVRPMVVITTSAPSQRPFIVSGLVASIALKVLKTKCLGVDTHALNRVGDDKIVTTDKRMLTLKEWTNIAI